MIQRACVRCGRIGPGSYCQAHKPKPWQGSTRSARLPKNWQGLRTVVLQRDPICKLCDSALSVECDHIQAGDDHSLENLQGVCVPCHRSKTGSEGRRARSNPPFIPVPSSGGPDLLVALVGAPGVGKTRVGLALRRKGYTFRSIDDEAGTTHRQRWTGLLRWIDKRSGTVIVESNVIPRALAARLESRRSLVAELVVNQRQQRRQLLERGDEWMADADIGYPADLEVAHPGADTDIVRAMARLRDGPGG